MDHEEKLYTAAQIQIAARDLQDAAGSPETPLAIHGDQTYNLEQAINALSAEIRLLRERGFTSVQIAALFTSFEIDADADDIEDFYERTDIPR